LIFIVVIFEIANSTNRFAKLKALERIDELSGIVTDAEAMKNRSTSRCSSCQLASR